MTLSLSFLSSIIILISHISDRVKNLKYGGKYT
jgi:hypothetical protein